MATNRSSGLNGREPASEGPARRSELLAVAADLFAAQGFEATTLVDIAKASGLKKASLYHYFSSKQSMLVAVLAEGIDELLGTAASAVTIENPAERLDALLRAHLQNFEHKLAHVSVFLLERRVMEREPANSRDAKRYLKQRRAYDQMFVDCIRDGQASGDFRDGDPVVLAYGLLGMLNWMVQWYQPRGRLSMDEIGAVLRDCAHAAVARRDDKPSAGGRRRALQPGSDLPGNDGAGRPPRGSRGR
jgi:AcrR family transcriptional regulator